MNKFFLLVLLLFTFAKLHAQKKLAGTVYMYNENGNNTTLAGVSVKTAGGGTTYTTHTKGYYELEFDGNVNVARIFASKSGMEVINQESLDRIDLKKNSNQNIYFDIDGNTRKRRNEIEEAALRANKEKIGALEAKNKQAYELKKILERKYDTTFSDIDQLIAYEIELYTRNKKTIEELAPLLVRINLDHDNKQAEQLLHLFKIGEIDSARRLFDIIEFVKNVNVLLTQIDKKKEVGLAAIPILLASNDYDAVDTVYKYLLKIDPENVDMIWQYGNFLSFQNKTRDAELFFEKLLTNSGEKDEFFSAAIFEQLGLIQHKNYDTGKALQSFSQALTIYNSIFQKKDSAYILAIANTLIHIGSLHRTRNEYKEAMASFESALEIYERAASIDSLFLPNVAITLRHIGVLQRDFANNSIGLNILLDAVRTFRVSAKPHNDLYYYDLGLMLYELAIAQRRNNNIQAAEITINEVYEIRTKLAAKYPQAYIPDLIQTLYELIDIRLSVSSFDTTNIHLLNSELFNAINQLTKSPLYDELLSEYYYNRGRVFLITGNTDSALSYCEKAMTLVGNNKNYITEKRNKILGILNNLLANIQGTISYSLLFAREYTNSESAGRRGLEHDSTQIWIYTNLAHALLFQGKYPEAEKIYLSLKGKMSEHDRTKTYTEILLSDFEELEKKGAIPLNSKNEVNKIIALLKE